MQSSSLQPPSPTSFPKLPPLENPVHSITLPSPSSQVPTPRPPRKPTKCRRRPKRTQRPPPPALRSKPIPNANPTSSFNLPSSPQIHSPPFRAPFPDSVHQPQLDESALFAPQLSAYTMPLSQNVFTRSSDIAAASTAPQTERLTAIESAPDVITNISDRGANLTSTEGKPVSKYLASMENPATNATMETVPSVAQAETGETETVRRRVCAMAKRGAEADAPKGDLQLSSDAACLPSNQEMVLLPYFYHLEEGAAHSGAPVEASGPGGLYADRKASANILNGSAGVMVPCEAQNVDPSQVIQQGNAWSTILPHSASQIPRETVALPPGLSLGTVQDGNLLTSMQLDGLPHGDGGRVSSIGQPNQTAMPDSLGNCTEKTGGMSTLPGVVEEVAANTVTSSFMAQTTIPAFHGDNFHPYHNQGLFMTTGLLSHTPHPYSSPVGYTAGSSYGYSPSLNAPLLSPMQASNQFGGLSSAVFQSPFIGTYPVSLDAAVPSSHGVALHTLQVHQTMTQGQEVSNQSLDTGHDVQQASQALQSVQNPQSHDKIALSARANNLEGNGRRDAPSESAVTSKRPTSKKSLHRYDEAMAPVPPQPAGEKSIVNTVQDPERSMSPSKGRVGHASIILGKGEESLKEAQTKGPSVAKASALSRKGSRGIAKPKRTAGLVRGDGTQRAVAISRKQYNPTSRTNSVAVPDAVGFESHEALEPPNTEKNALKKSTVSYSSVKPTSKRPTKRRERHALHPIPREVGTMGLAKGSCMKRCGAVQQAGPSQDKLSAGPCPTASHSTVGAYSMIQAVTEEPLQSVPVPHRDEAAKDVGFTVVEHPNQGDAGPLVNCRENNSVVDVGACQGIYGEERDSSTPRRKPFARRRRPNPALRRSDESVGQQQGMLITGKDGNEKFNIRRPVQRKGRAGVVNRLRFANDLKGVLGPHPHEQQFASRNPRHDHVLTKFASVESEGIQRGHFNSVPSTTVNATLSATDRVTLEMSNGNLHKADDLGVVSSKPMAPSEMAKPSTNMSTPVRSNLTGSQPQVSSRNAQTSSATALEASGFSSLESDAPAEPNNLSKPANSDTQKGLKQSPPVYTPLNIYPKVAVKRDSTTEFEMKNLPKLPKTSLSGARGAKSGAKVRQKADAEILANWTSPRGDGRNLSVADVKIKKKSIIPKPSKPTTPSARHRTNINGADLSSKRTQAQSLPRMYAQESTAISDAHSNAVTSKQGTHDTTRKISCESKQFRALGDHVKSIDRNSMPVKSPSASFPVPVKLQIRDSNKSSTQQPTSVSIPKTSASRKSGKSSKTELAGKSERSSRAQKTSQRRNGLSSKASMKRKKPVLESPKVHGTRNTHDAVVCGNLRDNVTENSSQLKESDRMEDHGDRKCLKVSTESSVSVPSPVRIASKAVADQGHSRTHPRPAVISAVENSLKKSPVTQPSFLRVESALGEIFTSRKRVLSQSISQRDPKKPRAIPESVFLNLGQLRCGLCQRNIGFEERAEHPLFPMRSLNICRTCYGTVCKKYEERREQMREQKSRLFIAVVEEMIRCLRPSDRKAASIEVFYKAILVEDFQEILRRAKSHPVPFEMLGVMRVLFRCVGVSFKSGKLVMPDHVLSLPSSEDIRNIIIEAIPRSLSDLESGTTAGQRLWAAVFGDNLTAEAPVSACVVMRNIFGLIDIGMRHIGVCEWSINCPQTTCNIKLDEDDLNQVCSRGAASKVAIRQVFPAGPERGLRISEGHEDEKKISDDVIFGSADGSCCICTQSHNTTNFPFEFMRCSDCSRKFCSLCLTNVLGSMEYIRAASDESYCCMICRMKLPPMSTVKNQDTLRTPNESKDDAKRRGKPRGSLRNNSLPLLLLSRSIRGRLQGVEVDERDVGFAKLCESLNSRQVSHLQGKRSFAVNDDCCLRCRLPIKSGYTEASVASRSRRTNLNEQTFLKCTERNCQVVMHKHCYSIRKPTKTRGAFSGMLCPRHKCLVCQGKGEAKLTRCRTCPSTYCREHVPRPRDVHIFSEKLIACSDCKANLHLPQISIQRPPVISGTGGTQAGNDIAKSILLSQRQKHVTIEDEVAELKKAEST